MRAAIGVHEKLLTKRAKQISAGKTDRAAAAAVEVAQAAAAAGQKVTARPNPNSSLKT